MIIFVQILTNKSILTKRLQHPHLGIISTCTKNVTNYFLFQVEVPRLVYFSLKNRNFMQSKLDYTVIHPLQLFLIKTGSKK